MIVKSTEKIEDIAVRGVTSNKNEAKITICAVPDKPGVSAKFFNAIACGRRQRRRHCAKREPHQKDGYSLPFPKRIWQKAMKAPGDWPKPSVLGDILNKIRPRFDRRSGMRSHQGIAPGCSRPGDAQINIRHDRRLLKSASPVSLPWIRQTGRQGFTQGL